MANPYHATLEKNWWNDTKWPSGWPTQTYKQPTTLPDYYNTVNQMGGISNFMENYPEVYNPDYVWYQDPRITMPSDIRGQVAGIPDLGGLIASCARDRQEIQDWKNVGSQIEGITGTYIRWLIDRKVNDLQYSLNKQLNAVTSYRANLVKKAQAAASGLSTGTPAEYEILSSPDTTYAKRITLDEGTPTEISPEAKAKIMGMNTGVVSKPNVPTESPVPVPAWMQPFLASPVEQVAEQTGKRNAVAGTQPTLGMTAETGLRPMSAQADLTPEQMGLMAGYEAWARAGRPQTLRSPSDITALSNWQPWWQQYTKLSESLFPSQVKLGQRKATVRQ